MPSPRQKIGATAEQAAADFLRQRGLTIIDRHVTSRYGEIDILAEDGRTIVAIEVKARRGQSFGPAIASVTPQKMSRLMQAFQDIALKRGWQKRAMRIDVVTLDRLTPQGQYSLSHYIGVGN